MLRSLTAALVLLVVTSAPVGAATSVEVNTCGQIVPDNALGFLSADLDCTAFTSGPANASGSGGAAVYLGKRSFLDLRGFSLTAGTRGVACDGLICGPLGQPCSRGPCQIFNGTITGSANSDVAISGNKPSVHDLTIDGTFNFGIYGATKMRVTNVVVSGCADTGINGYGAPKGFHSMKIVGATVTNCGRFGVASWSEKVPLHLTGSSVTGNGTAPACATMACGDVFSRVPPKLLTTTCDKSVSPSGNWGVCTLD